MCMQCSTFYLKLACVYSVFFGSVSSFLTLQSIIIMLYTAHFLLLPSTQGTLQIIQLNWTKGKATPSEETVWQEKDNSAANTQGNYLISM